MHHLDHIGRYRFSGYRQRDIELPLAQEFSTMPYLHMSEVATQEWENEGGHLRPVSEVEALGITRLMTETYLVDGYRYTTLTDALAQAHRRDRMAAS